GYFVTSSRRHTSFSRDWSSDVCSSDLGMIDGRPVAEQGIIRPEHEPMRRDQWPEAIHLLAHHTSLCYTVETPSAYDFTERVATLVDVVKASIAVVCNSRTSL